MAMTRRVGQLWAISLMAFAFGCGSGERDKRGLGIFRQDVTTGNPFSVTTNPIVTHDRAHYSSDPAIVVLDGYQQNPSDTPRSVLVMATSTDLVDLPPNNFPMDGTRLYATFGNVLSVPNESPLASTWYEYGPNPGSTAPGPVIDESDFDNWAKDGANQMFAPDIQDVPQSEGPPTLFLYIPDVDNGNTKRIGVATAESPGGVTLYDEFIPRNQDPNDFFKILPGNPLLANNGLPPNNGFAFDPGVFHAQDMLGTPPRLNDGYFMAYGDGIANSEGTLFHKNLSMVQIDAPDMMTGTYLGKIGFSTYQSYSGLDKFMEGPDVHPLTVRPNNSANPGKYYYLVFVSQVEEREDLVNPENTDTSYIGYAMCTPAAFWASPTNCWQFKGWLFRNQHTGRNNHINLATFNGRHYVFFHRVPPVLNTAVGQAISRSREVCVKEIELINNPGQADDGEIRGVKPAANQNIARDFTTLDGLTKGLGKGFIHFRDESTVPPRTPFNPAMPFVAARIRLSGLNPNAVEGLTAETGFRLFYYVDIEPGSNLIPSLSEQTDSNLRLAMPPLKHIGMRTWAVVLEYTFPTSGPINTNVGGLLTLTYDAATSTTNPLFFNRANDFSQPVDVYHSWTTRVGLMSLNDRLIAGETPEIVVPKLIRTDAVDFDNRFTYLTVSTNQLGVGINNQYLVGTAGATPGVQANQQHWILEDASNFPFLSDQDKQNAVRVRSVSAGFYMTANDVTRIDNAHPEFFWLLSQALRPIWDTQIWIKDPVDAAIGRFRIRSAWKPFDSDSQQGFDSNMFMTRDDQRGGNRGLQDVFVQPTNGFPNNIPNDRQKWFIEDVPKSRYFRTAVRDASDRFTYLTVSAAAVNSGINNQYVNTGAPSQEWVFESAADFPLPPGQDPSKAFRLRNVWTGFYMTSNDDPNRNPHFQLLDQALNRSWNTQIWFLEGTGPFQVRSLFSPSGQTLFLTRNVSSSNTGTQGVYVQPQDATNSSRQLWHIE